MLYQKLMTGETPFVVRLGDFSSFPTHKHHEIEVHFVVSGKAVITVDGKEYPVSAGEAVFVGSMRSHSLKVTSGYRALMLELGPAFLTDSFGLVSDAYRDDPFLFGKNKENGTLKATLSALLSEQEKYQKNAKNPGIGKLAITGLLYKFCSEIAAENATIEPQIAENPENAGIYAALDLVHERYASSLTLDEASAASGYGKSNFCKLFKNAVGVSFHAYLNGYRVRSAGYLLENTDLPLSEIAEQSGFSDQKTFCRVFSHYTGTTPGKYRKNFTAKP